MYSKSWETAFFAAFLFFYSVQKRPYSSRDAGDVSLIDLLSWSEVKMSSSNVIGFQNYVLIISGFVFLLNW